MTFSIQMLHVSRSGAVWLASLVTGSSVLKRRTSATWFAPLLNRESTKVWNAWGPRFCTILNKHLILAVVRVSQSMVSLIPIVNVLCSVKSSTILTTWSEVNELTIVVQLFLIAFLCTRSMFKLNMSSSRLWLFPKYIQRLPVGDIYLFRYCSLIGWTRWLLIGRGLIGYSAKFNPAS
jgi:hypothetical protein